MTSPDTAAMAVAWSERAKAALDLSRQYLAGAEAVIEQDSPVGDSWHAELRREVYRHLTAVADRYEWYADQARQSARDCQTFKPTAAAHYSEQARQAHAAPGVYSPTQLMREHAPGHAVGYQAGPGGMYAAFCKVDGCDFHEVTGGRSA